jgi:hypothetical protein
MGLDGSSSLRRRLSLRTRTVFSLLRWVLSQMLHSDGRQHLVLRTPPGVEGDLVFANPSLTVHPEGVPTPKTAELVKPEIDFPKPDDQVGTVIAVTGTVGQMAAGAGIAVLVRPDPASPRLARTNYGGFNRGPRSAAASGEAIQSTSATRPLLHICASAFVLWRRLKRCDWERRWRNPQPAQSAA